MNKILSLILILTFISSPNYSFANSLLQNQINPFITDKPSPTRNDHTDNLLLKTPSDKINFFLEADQLPRFMRRAIRTGFYKIKTEFDSAFPETPIPTEHASWLKKSRLAKDKSTYRRVGSLFVFFQIERNGNKEWAIALGRRKGTKNYPGYIATYSAMDPRNLLQMILKYADYSFRNLRKYYTEDEMLEELQINNMLYSTDFNLFGRNIIRHTLVRAADEGLKHLGFKPDHQNIAVRIQPYLSTDERFVINPFVSVYSNKKALSEKEITSTLNNSQTMGDFILIPISVLDKEGGSPEENMLEYYKQQLTKEKPGISAEEINQIKLIPGLEHQGVHNLHTFLKRLSAIANPSDRFIEYMKDAQVIPNINNKDYLIKLLEKKLLYQDNLSNPNSERFTNIIQTEIQVNELIWNMLIDSPHSITTTIFQSLAGNLEFSDRIKYKRSKKIFDAYVRAFSELKINGESYAQKLSVRNFILALYRMGNFVLHGSFDGYLDLTNTTQDSFIHRPLTNLDLFVMADIRHDLPFQDLNYLESTINFKDQKLRKVVFSKIAYKIAKMGIQAGLTPIVSIAVNTKTGEFIISDRPKVNNKKYSTTIHAEMNALQKAKKASWNIKEDVEIFVTLESCNACALSLATHYKPKKVYYLSVDGFKSISGRGAQLLNYFGLDGGITEDPYLQKLMQKILIDYFNRDLNLSEKDLHFQPKDWKIPQLFNDKSRLLQIIYHFLNSSEAKEDDLKVLNILVTGLAIAAGIDKKKVPEYMVVNANLLNFKSQDPSDFQIHKDWREIWKNSQSRQHNNFKIVVVGSHEKMKMIAKQLRVEEASANGTHPYGINNFFFLVHGALQPISVFERLANLPDSSFPLEKRTVQEYYHWLNEDSENFITTHYTTFKSA